MSLIKGFAKDGSMPIFDNVEFAKGCEKFIFRAKTEAECWDMCHRFLYTVPSIKQVKAYRIGLRPDYPVPVARYFIEVSVSDPLPAWSCWGWTCVENGRLQE